MVSCAVASCLIAAAAGTAEAMHFNHAPEPFLGTSRSDVHESGGAGGKPAEEPRESEEPPRHNLGIHFFPDNGEGLGGVVANLSAGGVQVRYSVEAMETGEPTPWRTFWNRGLCVKKREAQYKDDYFLACEPNAPVIWTPKHKLAYMKIPKAASTAFWYFFRSHFSDSEEISPKDLPKDAYVFTFAREPFEQKLAGFAEVDLKTLAKMETTLDSSTTFQYVPASHHNGQSRFAAFLDDVWERRFRAEDARQPGHAGNQVGGALCTHSVDFFGHLEHLTTDWDQIQTEAKLPQELRTKALPIVHAGTDEFHKRYKYDESIPLTSYLKDEICKIYRSEFACLGYDAPWYCQKYGLS